jgi:glycosyltransferase involved in cell wall biosynthesis
MSELPFVSICTPTFNRRPFFPSLIKCVANQLYPKHRIEWIIIDDGPDKIEDLVVNIPYVKYVKMEEHLTIAKKRNLLNDMSKGDIIVNMDDDDYYPPERISHAVEMLTQNDNVLCAGASQLYMYFNKLSKMYRFGPYGVNHATAATFAYKRELLTITRYNDETAFAEEKMFLKNYTIPMVQLDPVKTILVFAHSQNSVDKYELLKTPSIYINESIVSIDDFIKDVEIKQFFLHDITEALNSYVEGDKKHKPDILKQIIVSKIIKTNKTLEHELKQFREKHSAFITQQNMVIQSLLQENAKLKEENNYLKGQQH